MYVYGVCHREKEMYVIMKEVCNLWFVSADV